jgi:hypothetical protein
MEFDFEWNLDILDEFYWSYSVFFDCGFLVQPEDKIVINLNPHDRIFMF